MRQSVIASLLFMALATSACATPRTAAATQKTPAAFDPSTSDAKALEAVDAMVTALGGADKWAQVKQIRWDVKYYQGNDLRGWFKHAWDMWNGRHRYEFAPAAELQAEKPVFTFAMYDLFDRSGGFVANTKHPHQNAPSEDRGRIIANAYENWQRDAYQVSMFYKLRDPGVKLEYTGERQDFLGLCMTGCLDIKVSFVPEVGADVYHVLINKDTMLPEVVEKTTATGKLGFHIAEWATVNGLKFPAVYKNLGAEEKFVLENIRIGEPDDELYVPQVLG